MIFILLWFIFICMTQDEMNVALGVLVERYNTNEKLLVCVKEKLPSVQQDLIMLSRIRRRWRIGLDGPVTKGDQVSIGKHISVEEVRKHGQHGSFH